MSRLPGTLIQRVVAAASGLILVSAVVAITHSHPTSDISPASKQVANISPSPLSSPMALAPDDDSGPPPPTKAKKPRSHSAKTIPSVAKTGRPVTIVEATDAGTQNADPGYTSRTSTIPISSTNVEWVGNIPTRGGLFFGTPGGRFKKVQTPLGPRTYFFTTGMFNGLTILDATTPRQPVVVAEMPLPHWENEDVDVAGSTVLVSIDGSFGARFFVIDISIPSAPHLRGSYAFANDPATWGSRKPGHIANCINDCRYAWVTGAGGGYVAIFDLGDSSQFHVDPVLVATIRSPAGNANPNPDATAFTQYGVVHNVDVDPTGMVWLTGSGGLTAYGIGGNHPGSPTAPVAIASNPGLGLDTFILHNSLKPTPSPYVYVTEEAYEHVTNDCQGSGRFEIYAFDGTSLNNVSAWTLSPKQGLASLSGTQPEYLCSAHWFDYHDGLIAIGKYQQGIGILDVKDPQHVKEIGWWLAPDTVGSAVYFHPDDPSIIYAADYQRGIDILHLCAADCPLGGGVGGGSSLTVHRPLVTATASKTWGFSCPIFTPITISAESDPNKGWLF